jgi:hypothetical protein
MRYLLKGDAQTELHKVVKSSQASSPLCGPANALKLGFVEGVSPYVYVERIRPSDLSAFKNLRQSEDSEIPDLLFVRLQRRSRYFVE